MNRKTIRREDPPSSSSSPTTDSKDTKEWFVCMHCTSTSRRAFRLGKDLIFHKRTVHPKQFKLQRRTRRKRRRLEEQSGTSNKPNSRSQGHEESLSTSAPKNCSSFKLVAGKMGVSTLSKSKRGETTSTDVSLSVVSHNAASASGILPEVDKWEACAKSHVTATYTNSTKIPPIGIATRIRIPTQNSCESTEARSNSAVKVVPSIDEIQGGGIATSTRVSATAGVDWEETNKIKHSALTDPSRTCIYCRKCFASKRSVASHMRLHTGKESFQCSECPEKFSRHDARNAHELSRHQKGISSATASETASDKINGLKPTVKELTCEFCPQTFSSEQYLNEHDATHVKFARIKIKRLRLDRVLGVHRVRKERIQLGELEQKNESQPKPGRMMDSRVSNDIITTDFQPQDPRLEEINSNYHDCNYCEEVFSSQTYLYQHEAKVHLNVLH